MSDDKRQEPVHDDLLVDAWGLIANAGEGNWETQTDEWQEAAVRWRDAWHAYLDATLEAAS